MKIEMPANHRFAGIGQSIIFLEDPGLIT